MLQLVEINLFFLPSMYNKLLWFYQEVEDTEPSSTTETVSVLKKWFSVFNLQHMVASTEVMLHSFLYVIEFQLCELDFYLYLHLHRQSIK
jgi:hypothetical protein